ncbi:MAG: hypothetical protein FJX52_06890, partial [Alphaproteobacteria bacterium]|nr:hypothetical protein [Alphaproteobacteria bacterium]
MRRTLPIAAASLLLANAAATEARVVKFEVASVETPTFEGRSFGAVGAYEQITARATMAVDPSAARNAGIVDLDRAPRNARGQAEFSADVVILKQVSMARASGRLFYDVLNRGNKLGLVLMNDAPGANNPRAAAHAGNGFLMEQGHVVVWSAWQADVPPGAERMLLSVPIAAGTVGESREEFIFDGTTNPVSGNPVTVALSYPAADLDPARARLSVRARETDPRQTPADLRFRYVDSNRIEIARPAGFDAGALYEFIYPARDSKVMGLGFAATRDIVS